MNGSSRTWVSFNKEQKASVRADLECDLTWRSFQMKRVQRSVTEMTPEMRAELRALNCEALKRSTLKPNASVMCILIFSCFHLRKVNDSEDTSWH